MPGGPTSPRKPGFPGKPWRPGSPLGPGGPCGPTTPPSPLGPGKPIAPGGPMGPGIPGRPGSPGGPPFQEHQWVLFPLSAQEPQEHPQYPGPLWVLGNLAFRPLGGLGVRQPWQSLFPFTTRKSWLARDPILTWLSNSRHPRRSLNSWHTNKALWSRFPWRPWLPQGTLWSRKACHSWFSYSR